MSTTSRVMKSFTLNDFLKRSSPLTLDKDEMLILKRSTSAENAGSYLERFSRDPSKTKLITWLILVQAGHNGLIASDDDPFEIMCFEAFKRYEDVRREVTKKPYTAVRLRQAGKLRTWASIIDSTVSKPLKDETDGFKSLREHKCLDASFEMFVLENPGKFSDKAVKNSFIRLNESKLITLKKAKRA
jgi:hypothetical protein